jgi:hypothetical protein
LEKLTNSPGRLQPDSRTTTDLTGIAVREHGEHVVRATFAKHGLANPRSVPPEKEGALRAALLRLLHGIPGPSITIFESANGASISKRFTITHDGQLKSEKAAPFYAGTFTTKHLAPAELASLLPQLGPHQALAHGIAKAGRVDGTIVTIDALANGTAPAGAIARASEYFEFGAGPAYLMLDVDLKDLPQHLAERVNSLSISGLREVLISAVPTLADVPMVGTASASTMIYREPRRANGSLLRGRTGARFYVPVDDARDIPEIGRRLHERLILAGWGWPFISKAGTIPSALRSLIDASVWQPERLDYAGGASLGPGLVQDRGKPLLWNEDARNLTLADVPPLTEAERAQLDEITTRFRAQAKPDAERVRAARLADQRKAGRRVAVSDSDSGDVTTLDGEHDIILPDSRTATVDDILDDPKAFHGLRCADPIDPDGYGGDHRIAVIYSDQPEPVIYSHAHGGQTYILRRSAASEFGVVEGAEPPVQHADRPPTPADQGREPSPIERANAEFALVHSRPGVVLVRRPNRAPEFLPINHWRTLTKNRPRVPRARGRPLTFAEWWLSHPERLTLDDVVTDPDQSPHTIVQTERGTAFNLWGGFAVKPSAHGSCDLFLQHVHDKVAAGVEETYRYVLMWLAAAVQKPGRLPGTALVLRGGQGTGKSMIGTVMRALLGEQLTLVLSKAKEVIGEFNGAHEGKVLIQAEEALFAGDRSGLGALKNLITSSVVTVRNLYQEARQVRNLAHVLMTTNETWVVPAGESERRFTVLDVENDRAHDPEYFGPIFRQLFEQGGLARLMYHLLYEVEVDWQVIARPLRTQALMEQQLDSLDGMSQWWLERLRTGSLPGGGNAPLAQDLFTSIRESLRNRYEAARASNTRIGQFLAKIGAKRVRQRTRTGSRVYHYEFPPLTEARVAFARRLAVQPDWDDVNEWQAVAEELSA